jgi:hypothetical protein
MARKLYRDSELMEQFYMFALKTRAGVSCAPVIIKHIGLEYGPVTRPATS